LVRETIHIIAGPLRGFQTYTSSQPAIGSKGFFLDGFPDRVRGDQTVFDKFLILHELKSCYFLPGVTMWHVLKMSSLRVQLPTACFFLFPLNDVWALDCGPIAFIICFHKRFLG